jgi:hypothetical protein
MAYSTPTRITITNKYENNDGIDRECDENSPLLRHQESKLSIKGSVVAQNDVEAGSECSSPLVDKQPGVETSRNVAGVISILLLG